MVQREPECLYKVGLQFIGEQDGEPERELKRRIGNYLSSSSVSCRAYLARVKYSEEEDDDEEFSVSLCIGGIAPSDTIISDVGKIFSAMFRTDEYLDVIYISERQEDTLKRVANPFYSQ